MIQPLFSPETEPSDDLLLSLSLCLSFISQSLFGSLFLYLCLCLSVASITSVVCRHDCLSEIIKGETVLRRERYCCFQCQDRTSSLSSWVHHARQVIESSRTTPKWTRLFSQNEEQVTKGVGSFIFPTCSLHRSEGSDALSRPVTSHPDPQRTF